MTDHKPRTVWPWIVGTVLALVLYVFSIGPAFWILEPRCATCVLVYQKVYAPLFWLSDRSVGADKLLCDYLSFCIGAYVVSDKQWDRESGASAVK